MIIEKIKQLWKVSKGEICCAGASVAIAAVNTLHILNNIEPIKQIGGHIMTAGFLACSAGFSFCAYRNYREDQVSRGNIVENDFWESSKKEISLAAISAGLTIGQGAHMLSAIGASAQIVAAEAVASTEITMGLALTTVLLACLAKHRYDISQNKKGIEGSAPHVA